MPYKHLFFDLDHTLWDFDRNSTETLRELYRDFTFESRFGFSEQDFLAHFVEVNRSLWALYNVGKISRDEIRSQRFHRVLDGLRAPREGRPANLGEEYLSRCPLKPHCLPHTHELLEYLQGKGYRLHIITNGFDDVQAVKLNSARLTPFFEAIVTSETSGYKKPAPEIFFHALRTTGADVRESLMIGDNLETDIAGARAADMDHVFFNPRRHFHKHRPTYEIETLKELMQVL